MKYFLKLFYRRDAEALSFLIYFAFGKTVMQSVFSASQRLGASAVNISFINHNKKGEARFPFCTDLAKADIRIGLTPV
jgi:hypothetical protein